MSVDSVAFARGILQRHIEQSTAHSLVYQPGQASLASYLGLLRVHWPALLVFAVFITLAVWNRRQPGYF